MLSSNVTFLQHTFFFCLEAIRRKNTSRTRQKKSHYFSVWFFPIYLPIYFFPSICMSNCVSDGRIDERNRDSLTNGGVKIRRPLTRFPDGSTKKNAQNSHERKIEKFARKLSRRIVAISLRAPAIKCFPKPIPDVQFSSFHWKLSSVSKGFILGPSLTHDTILLVIFRRFIYFSIYLLFIYLCLFIYFWCPIFKFPLEA